MNIKQLLDYQKADLEFADLLKKRNATPEVDKYLKAKKIRDFSLQHIAKLNADSKQYYAQMEKLIAAHKEINEEIDAILESINQINQDNFDDEEIDFLSHRLDTLTSEINDISKEVSALSERVVNIRKEYENDNTNVGTARGLLESLKENVSKILETYKPLMDKAQENKDAIKKQLSAEDVELYEKISAVKKGVAPVIVPLEFSSYCGGCKRELSKAQVQEANSNGHVVCLECSRIVYKED